MNPHDGKADDNTRPTLTGPELANSLGQLDGRALAAAIVRLDHTHLWNIRQDFVRWLMGTRASFPSWREAFDAWTGADRGLGTLTVQGIVCPACRGSRMSYRTGRVCLECLNGHGRVTVKYQVRRIAEGDAGGRQ